MQDIWQDPVLEEMLDCEDPETVWDREMGGQRCSFRSLWFIGPRGKGLPCDLHSPALRRIYTYRSSLFFRRSSMSGDWSSAHTPCLHCQAPHFRRHTCVPH